MFREIYPTSESMSLEDCKNAKKLCFSKTHIGTARKILKISLAENITHLNVEIDDYTFTEFLFLTILPKLLGLKALSLLVVNENILEGILTNLGAVKNPFVLETFEITFAKPGKL